MSDASGRVADLQILGSKDVISLLENSNANLAKQGLIVIRISDAYRTLDPDRSETDSDLWAILQEAEDKGAGYLIVEK